MLITLNASFGGDVVMWLFERRHQVSFDQTPLVLRIKW